MYVTCLFNLIYLYMSGERRRGQLPTVEVPTVDAGDRVTADFATVADTTGGPLFGSEPGNRLELDPRHLELYRKIMQDKTLLDELQAILNNNLAPTEKAALLIYLFQTVEQTLSDGGAT